MTRTIGAVLIKARQDKLHELIEQVPRFSDASVLHGYGIEKLRLAAHLAGPYDVLLIVEVDRANAIADFVLHELRQRLGHVIADTQTLVAWEMLLEERSDERLEAR